MAGKLADGIAVMVKKKGYPVHMDSPYCKKHKENHEDCRKCESEKGCGKVARIMLLIFEASSYEPKSFKEFQEVTKSVRKQVRDILDDKKGEE